MKKQTGKVAKYTIAEHELKYARFAASSSTQQEVGKFPAPLPKLYLRFFEYSLNTWTHDENRLILALN